MRLSLAARRLQVAGVMWLAVLIALLVWTHIPSYVVGWDLGIYRNAETSLRAGHDPYVDGMAVQRVFHEHLAAHLNESPPYTYVYSPMTLPLLRWVARFPFAWTDAVYWILYAGCTWVTVRVGLCAAEQEQEQGRVFRVLAPVLLFFPGLLHQDTLLSGNVAFVLYGCALGAAWLGWQRDRWAPFYVAVVIASVFKAPLLSLLAIPVFSGRKQLLPAGVAGAVGVALFAVQPRLWPETFSHFLQAVDLQFSYNRDFSSSPAGVLANLLYDLVPYRVTSLAAYLAYAVPVCWVMWRLRGAYLEGRLRWTQWMPVLLLGVILLNPRIMEYDLAPVAIPMALVVWRLFARGNSFGRTALEAGLFFAAINGFAANAWKPTESLVLLGVFTAGCVDLFREARAAGQRDEASLERAYAEGTVTFSEAAI